ncbi:hypothetical protein BVRB_5g126630 [Beta vulgaris subsp. vulgaris]|uniref:Stomagen C-terminal domain-containing protein n=1 Tax=Beta vulgaris subsp. vulgaris TaxID=3555 RepID=A0A0J8B886_BETVV|nr:uncharacterized protein LOC104908305 [Beta vulgaris subsp. vulgaris]KMS97479.1 hypothetical protein BVRB_5g126630 [Beta vulgaris subsp. vulgaris]
MATIMPVGEQANRVFLVVVTILIATLLVNPVIASYSESTESHISASNLNLATRKLHFQGFHGKSKDLKTKRMLIGSTAPTCTYNECRGCKYRCRAEQIPVDGNDPLNSAYRYKCVCHR